ncbi:MAG: hypothetical protein A2504_11390 [Bdellovibrionales bacterium RIFOXYD12_FULL_39_22]|nr:MAG: hypothetical protein A2385_09955 [Bdellovibrionales bacterium RIFOXYB1_FULL_39_21]OFZ44275.1 MAG: hypothetical protein A2485_07575 [Bdellovibrionales bacterium RIFOXYC12_FULL_39_17]OFZ46817.1 MAG: hypothetical protein A2404_04810 [Bdellovibrionales bacterium RIFOXYC1_FULL_39_130]OFZ71008.1 MAG: hypothetical protein A2451_00310 [Bdellovibrionales bacterium RIFOXYC2_FULL_39_8]OFZ75906.1 MAG: hypothetical protein A2560_02340 [Bdellovibrionales bacterium RIFOXYD1_FULL_39_84]OFZ95496.1 MAG:
MKYLLTSLSLFVSLALFVGSAMADDISLGEPGYGGTGCPQGSASATLSPDGKELSIIFDQFVVEAGGATRRSIGRKSCNVSIPVHVPGGFSISLIDADYRGYVMLPRSASATFTAEYFFAGQRGPMFSKVFSGPTDTDYTLEDTLGIFANVWSACGTDVNLRVNASMRVMTRLNQEALATVDSADFSAGIVYRIAFRRCH